MVMTPEQFAFKMQEHARIEDDWDRQYYMIHLMCLTLSQLGYSEGVNIYVRTEDK